MIIFTIVLLFVCAVFTQENSLQSVELAAHLARKIVSDAGMNDINHLYWKNLF